MRTVAVFMDAGYFWAQVHKIVIGDRTNRNNIFIDYPMLRTTLLEIVNENFSTSELLRVYWYDGPSISDSSAEHRNIQELDDFKLRLGTRNSMGQQKGVDGLIIADIISLTQTKAITDALLISGDADITPGVVAAQSLGLRVHQLSIGGLTSTSPFLLAEVDRGYVWDEKKILSFAKSQARAAEPPKSRVDDGKPNLSGKPAVTANLQQIAAEFKNGIEVSTGIVVQEKSPLPPELDGKLLSFGRKKIGRSLEEHEKRGLRAALKALFKPT